MTEDQMGTDEMRRADVRDILVRAKDLIQDRSHWTKRTLARAGRKCVGPREDAATRWCALGAIYKVCPDDLKCFSAQKVMIDVSIRQHGIGMIKANDTFSHLAILRLFDVAIDAVSDTEVKKL